MGRASIELVKEFWQCFSEQVITTVWIEADTGQKMFATSYFQIKDRKIARAEEYWAEPYEAADWRAKWVERY